MGWRKKTKSATRTDDPIADVRYIRPDFVGNSYDLALTFSRMCILGGVGYYGQWQLFSPWREARVFGRFNSRGKHLFFLGRGVQLKELTPTPIHVLLYIIEGDDKSPPFDVFTTPLETPEGKITSKKMTISWHRPPQAGDDKSWCPNDDDANNAKARTRWAQQGSARAVVARALIAAGRCCAKYRNHRERVGAVV